MLHEMGIETGVNLEKLIECAWPTQDLVGRPLDGHVAKSGPVNHTGLARPAVDSAPPGMQRPVRRKP